MSVETENMMDSAVTIALEDVPCPRCGGGESVVIHRCLDYIYGVPGEFFASRCTACGLWFQNPRPVLAQLADLYPVSYGPYHTNASAAASPAVRSGLAERLSHFKETLRQISWLRQLRRGWAQGYLVHYLGYRQFGGQTSLEHLAGRLGAALSLSSRWSACVDLVPHFVADGRLLEVGSGNGERLVQLRDMGWRHLHGVELSETSAAASREMGFDVMAGTIEDVLAHYPDNHFDVIVSAMVVEHLVNPFTTMRSIATKLKPGGELLFSTVIRDSADGWIFGQYGVSYDFPRHMVFFKKEDLLGMLKADFEGTECCHQCTPIDFTRPARLRGKWFDAWIANFFRLPGSRLLVKLLARLNLMGRVSIRCRRRVAANGGM